MTQEIHPIEVESYRRMYARVDLSSWPPGQRDVVARIIHASADLAYAGSLVITADAVSSGLQAVKSGAAVITDVEMTRAGIGEKSSQCYLSDANSTPTMTRSAHGIALAAQEHPVGAIWVVGCAPTALDQIISLVKSGELSPALVIGLPVGFVGAVESKESLRSCRTVPSITNVGEKGGSAVAAAAFNALRRLANTPQD